MWTRLGSVTMLATAFALLAGCGADSGACATHNSSYPSSWDACYDGQSANECNGFATYGDTVSFHEGKTCSSLGFTQECPGEDFHRYPAFPCP